MTRLQVVLFSILWHLSAGASAQQGNIACGSLDNHYGPFDYRAEHNGKLKIVDHAHFTAEVEALIRGNTSYLGDDLSYTLRASPNHHRALMAVMRLAERTHSPQPPHVQYSVECYFERAIRFRPDDTVVRSLYSQYLGRLGRTKSAIAQLDLATSYAKDNALSHFNIGLIYFELKEYDHALTQAHRALELGYASADLENMLKSVGKWKEPQIADNKGGAASSPR